MKRLVVISESATQSDRAVSPVRVALDKAHGMIGFIAIFASAMAGYAGLGVWTLAISAAALVAVSQAEHGALYRSAHAAGHTEAATSTLFKSMINAAAAAGATYAFGVALRMF